MRVLVTTFLLLAASVAQSQVLAPIEFSFKDIPLYTDFSEFPKSYKNECTSISSKNTFYCLKQVEVGSIVMDAEFYFEGNRLAKIEAYFPRDKFDLVFSALAKRYGRPHERNEKQYVWRSTPLALESPSPDELFVVRAADSTSMANIGKGAVNGPVSVLRYESWQRIRDKAAASAKSREQEVGNVSKDL